MLLKSKKTEKAAKAEKKPKSVKKSNITFGSLKGKLKVAKDTWDDDLKQTIH